MKPSDAGLAYDRIAAWWDRGRQASSAGIRFLERAVALGSSRGAALDVGCGSGGPLLGRLVENGFQVTGLDVSQGMLDLARQRHPEVRLIQSDVTTWTPDRGYDLVIAWDSTFHLPRASQEPVLRALCDALTDGGVILFTAGGVDGEVTGSMAGQQFHYTSLADEEWMRILHDSGCKLVLLDHDQFPEKHVVIIAVKVQAGFA